MPDPGFARPDFCSIRTAGGQEELAEAVRGGFSADGCPPGVDDPPAHRATGIDRAIRLSTAAAVLAVAGIAAYVSYWHAYAVVRAHGEAGITARLEPATIDGLVYACSMVVLYAARHRVPVPVPGPLAARAGNRRYPHGEHGPGLVPRPVGAVVAAWPAVSLVGSYELLVWLIRVSGAADREPPAEHLCTGAACCAAARPVPAPAIDGERLRGSERGMSDPAWRPAGQAAGHPAIPASGQRDAEAREASAVDDAAVAAYRLSVQAGNPLSERRLARMFGRTSRRWARARIADARQAAPFPDSPDTLVPAYAHGLGHSAGQALPGAALRGPVVPHGPAGAGAPRLSVVSWLKDSVCPPVQDCTGASMRSVAWRSASSRFSSRAGARVALVPVRGASATIGSRASHMCARAPGPRARETVSPGCARCRRAAAAAASRRRPRAPQVRTGPCAARR